MGKNLHRAYFRLNHAPIIWVLSGLIFLIFLGGCSDSTDENSQPDPSVNGCLDYSPYSIYSYTSLAAEAPWFRETRAVATQNDRAYAVGQRYGLQIFDISDRSNPILMSSMPFARDARAVEIAVLLDYAYVLDYDTDQGTLHVVDVSDSRAPRIARSIAVPGGRKGIDIVWPYAYVACGGLGLAVFDILQPELTKQVGQIELPNSIEDLAVSNGHAFCIGWRGSLHVVDVREPDNMQLVSSSPEGYNWSSGIDVKNGLAVISGDSLRIFDVTSPRQPRFLASHGTPGRGVVLQDQRALLLNDQDKTLLEIDLSDPGTPTLMATLELERCPTWSFSSSIGLETDGQYAYMALADYGFQIADISNPGQPTLLAHYANMEAPSDVAYLDGYLYVACDRNGIEIVNAMDPLAMKSSVRFDKCSSYFSIAENNGLIYAVGENGMTVLDVSNPVEPSVIGTVETGSYLEDWDVQSGLACFAYKYDEVVLVDASTPEAPVVLATVPVPGRPQAIRMSGGYAYVATDEEGLQVIDVDPPHEAAIVGSLEMLTETSQLTVDGNYLYLAADDFYSVDISDPTDPFVVGTCRGNFSQNYGMLTVGGVVYVKSTYRISIFDVSDPANPSGEPVLAHGGRCFMPRGLALGPEVVFIAMGGNSVLTRGGLGVMWRSCSEEANLSVPALSWGNQ